MQSLHYSDPDLVDYAVDTVNGMAIHYAVTTIPNPGGPLRDHSMLEYLLENGASVDVQGGKMYNTALHYALTEIVEMTKDNADPTRVEPLWECVRLLFSYGAKENLKNNDQKTALDIISDGNENADDKTVEHLLETYKRKKEAGMKALKNRVPSVSNGLDILVAGMNLSNTHEATLKRYVKENDDATKQMKKLAEQISQREIPETRFGLGMIFNE